MVDLTKKDFDEGEASMLNISRGSSRRRRMVRVGTNNNGSFADTDITLQRVLFLIVQKIVMEGFCPKLNDLYCTISLKPCSTAYYLSFSAFQLCSKK